MTKAEFDQFAEFESFEVCDENDSDIEKIIKPYDPEYTGGIREVRTVDEARKYLADPRWDHKGAIGYSDGEDIYLVFWEKR